MEQQTRIIKRNTTKKREQKERMDWNQFTFIDLFAGIGGIRLGFESVGGRCVFSSEIDPDACKTYTANFGEIPSGDITKIAAGEIPSKKLYEDEQVVAFFDINPQAKVHFLVIPKKHISSAAALTEEDGALLGHIFAVIAKLAKEQGLDNGYRVISNVGEDAGQTVKHLHFHVLGGEKLPV